jgi:hypothetical protein
VTFRLIPAKARIFRITHIDNIPWILRHGLHCGTSGTLDPNFRGIGSADLIEMRKIKTVPIPPEGTLGDYVPFYFTSRTPMLMNIKTGYNVPMLPMEEIVIIVSSLHRWMSLGIPFVFTDRRSYYSNAQFFADLADLERIDWDILVRSDFKRDVNDLDRKERYQAEALAHRHVPIAAVEGMICYAAAQHEVVTRAVSDAGVGLPVVVEPTYFV